MNTAYLEAFMLGYLKAAFKEHLSSELVDDLFDEAEAAARETLKKLEQTEVE